MESPPVHELTFKPAIDVVAGDGAVVLELALPGVDRDDITIERTPDGIAIRGVRRARAVDVFHAEIPRGPFFRSVPVPFAIADVPHTVLERGLLRIYLTKPITEPKQATGEQK
jgi:HSP20 family molecular chaperone IbpA